ncbi:hypothetical protein JTE90_026225 [Oedothorax gibbosus]|uniref:Uncharacterized protein n=1 Tax=Oedothorax gibbosus TaxID=931172 RepID=A0AAV6UBV8_9ARAC|nr:hypothetical protein JTE90_026225 [Oedothorax gibbosus]
MEPPPTPTSDANPTPGPSQEVPASPRTPRMSQAAVAAKAYAAKVTSMPSDSNNGSQSNGSKAKPTMRQTSRVARARITFLDAKTTTVREAVMPEGVPSETYYHLMVKSLVNLKDILNKAFNSKINSPSPVVPKKRRSSLANANSKAFDKPSKKVKKIIV